jgi:phytoene desaturase
MKKVSVVGGGIGGLAVAIRMAARGYQVSLFEKSEQVGGKMGQIKEQGFRFDTGPSLFTQPHLIEELIQICNKNPKEYFSYYKLKESCRYFFEDHTMIIGYSDSNLLAKELSKKTNVKSSKVLYHLKKSAFLYNSTRRLFLENSLHKINTYLNFKSFIAVCKLPFLDLFTSMSKRNKKRFNDTKTEQIFNRYATYNGSDPFKAPAILNLIPHLEINQGAYFPEKGMRSIANLLERLCREMGVQIHTNTSVESISHEDQKVNGVYTKDAFYESDIVVCNQDIFFVYERLLKNKKVAQELNKQERSTSAIIFYWGIDKIFDNLKLHNIFFSKNYKNEFHEISCEQNVPDDPTIYVNISSKEQKSDAPKNCENWFVMINTPSNYGQEWEAIIARTREKITQKLNRILGVSIENHIVFENILDPRSIESKTASYRGSLYGTASNKRKAAFFRHPNFSKSIKGLYFCGGSVHPGGGIPLALSSAKIVDKLIT